ncbi:MAG: ABC transporter substrate-binding protein, partial [Pseudomonadota bacterium]
MNKLAILRIRWICCWLLAFAMCSNAQAAAAQPSTAVEVVDSFQEQLLTVMREGKKLGFDGRFKHLQPAVRDSHDLTRIARIVLGKYWKELTDEQKRQFEKIFSELSVATYAYNFK